MSTWHDIRDPDDPLLDELASKYGLHALHIEDCRHRNQNAKVEAQDGYLFVVVKPVDLSEEGLVQPGDLDLFLGPDYLITVQETSCKSLAEVLGRAHAQLAKLRPDQIFYRVIDGVVDSYYPILDRLSDKIEEIENSVVADPQPELLQSLFRMRRTLVMLRRIMANSRDVMGHLLRNNYPQIGADMNPFVRDLYDHVVRNLDMIEVHRDLLTGVMELYLSAVSNRTNQVMKVLTVFGTIATPALVITGMYGMNLEHLPFADHPHSWGIVVTIIAAVSAIVLLVLRKLRWL